MYIFQLWNYIWYFDEVWYLRVILKIVIQIYWFELAHVTVRVRTHQQSQVESSPIQSSQTHKEAAVTL